MRKSKGTVGVESVRGRLRLRLPRAVYTGKQIYLSLGTADTKLNRKAAEAKAQLIELDILSGNFDASLDKYKPHQFTFTQKTEIEPDIEKLFNCYVEFKKNCSISQATIANDYARVKRIIKKFPSTSINDAELIRNWLLQNCTPNIAKRILVQLTAACNWGLRTKLIKINPFIGLAKDIKITRSTERNIAFSSIEKDAIIEAFKKTDSFYAPFITFLFLTGCRPSEAIALKWEDISENFILFRCSATDTLKGTAVKDGLKTQKSRRFPVNQQLKRLLLDIGQNKPKLVFPSKQGGLINFRNFCQRNWKTIFKSLDIDYRHPYSCRHTFISLCIESGVDVKDIAQWVGNSPEIIYKHYVTGKIRLEVPEL